MSLTQDDIKVLSKPFDDETIGVKVQSFSKDRTRAMLVLYLQHTDVYSRLEQVDPAWTMKVTECVHLGDYHYATVALTVKGVTRENTGEGNEPKGALSDAIKRAAMLFGVGRYLYDSDQVWVKYNENDDRYRTWTLKDYRDNSKKKPAAAASASASISAPHITPAPSRDFLNQKVMEFYGPYMKKYPGTHFGEVLKTRYGAAESRLLDLNQLKDFVLFLEKGLLS